MKNKNTFIILGLGLLVLMIIKPDFLSVVSDKNLLVFYNSRDMTDVFYQGDPIAVDTTFVQWDLDRKYNSRDVNRDQKEQYMRNTDGWIIWVDNKVYDRKIGSSTAWTVTDCGSLCSQPEIWSQIGMGVDASNCDQYQAMGRFVCRQVYSDSYLNANGLPSELMSQQEKNSLSGCHKVKACAARNEHINLNDGYERIAIEHTCSSRNVCWDGITPAGNQAPTDEVTPKILITPCGGGCNKCS
jgi:hypothetical protein